MNKQNTNTTIGITIIILILLIFGFLLFRGGIIGVEDGKPFFDCPMNNQNNNSVEDTSTEDNHEEETEDHEPTCADTDNGNNIYIFGTCSDSLGVVDSDNCIPEAGIQWISEAYCQDGVCSGISTECPDGYTCSGGECKLWEDLPRPCTTIWNPSQPICSEFGVCEENEQCVFVPADLNFVERCACIPI